MQTLADNIREVQAERRRREPLLIFMPWSIIKGQVEVVLYEDQRKEPIAEKMISLDTAMVAGKCAIDNGIAVYINMGHCIEWLHIRYMTDSVYTLNQVERFKKEDQKTYPEIEWLYHHKAGWDLIKVLEDMPQEIKWKSENKP